MIRFPHARNSPLIFQDIQEANFRTSSSRLLAAVMSALCNTSVKLTSILPIAYDGEVLLRSLVKQVSTENDSALAHRFPLLVAHMEKLSHVRVCLCPCSTYKTPLVFICYNAMQDLILHNLLLKSSVMVTLLTSFVLRTLFHTWIGDV